MRPTAATALATVRGRLARVISILPPADRSCVVEVRTPNNKVSVHCVIVTTSGHLPSLARSARDEVTLEHRHHPPQLVTAHRALRHPRPLLALRGHPIFVSTALEFGPRTIPRISAE